MVITRHFTMAQTYKFNYWILTDLKLVLI